jgi:predicted ATPase
MLTCLNLTNFKAWKEVPSMTLAPLTGLFGANSSGKSSILQFLLMLKQTADSADRGSALQLGDEKSLTSLGTFPDILHKLATDGGMSFGVRWRSADTIDIKDPDTDRASLVTSRDMGFDATLLGNGGGKVSVTRLRYALGDAEFEYAAAPEPKGFQLTAKSGGFRFVRADGRKWPLPPPVKFYGFADEVRTYHKNAGFLAELELQFERMLRAVYYLGPLREFPKREYTWAGGDPADMGRRGEFAIAAMLASRERGERIQRGRGKKRYSLEEYVAHWLQELGLISEFRVEEIAKGTNLYRVKVRKTPTSPEVLITDVGFGVSQVLPVLVLCYYAPEGSTILFEQPEIHLHPSVQAGLADVFIDAIRQRGVQIVVESHSEHFLRRLQRQVAEGTRFTADETALYFCEIDSGSAKLTKLHVDLYGDIQNWPRDFFGDEMSDIAARLQAARAKRQASQT